MIADRISLLVIAVGVTLVVAVGYLRLGDRALALLPRAWNRRLLPWLFVGPAAAMVGFTLVFPALLTVVFSFFDSEGSRVRRASTTTPRRCRTRSRRSRCATPCCGCCCFRRLRCWSV
ncbi:MAG: hypothetical protein WKF73_04840 [Nocardioidaceae bacterium]